MEEEHIKLASAKPLGLLQRLGVKLAADAFGLTFNQEKSTAQEVSDSINSNKDD